jgi:hypothetical protein
MKTPELATIINELSDSTEIQIVQHLKNLPDFTGYWCETINKGIVQKLYTDAIKAKSISDILQNNYLPSTY